MLKRLLCLLLTRQAFDFGIRWTFIFDLTVDLGESFLVASSLRKDFFFPLFLFERFNDMLTFSFVKGGSKCLRSLLSSDVQCCPGRL